jgi:hypothetical protein
MNLRLLILSSIFILLPGCAILDAYFMARYDTSEYYIITNIRVKSEIGQQYCTEQGHAKIVFDNLYEQSKVFLYFTENIPKNNDANELAKNLVELTTQGKKQYSGNETVSAGFCKLKLQQINRTSESIQKVIGSKAR